MDDNIICSLCKEYIKCDIFFKCNKCDILLHEVCTKLCSDKNICPHCKISTGLIYDTK